jgi:phosphoglycolate phosphatase-like HAD superfamily hydrolase
VRRVYLFDVDGTLVKTGGAGSRALSRAFGELYGVPEAMDGVRPHGKTDYAICREAFAAALGRAEVEAAEIARVLEVYVPLLEEEVRASPTYAVLPGVSALLRDLCARGDLVGLATGNIERGARVKIERAGLNRCFAFGGFGDDAEDRVAIVRAARERGERALGARVDGQAIFVVGDTVLDVRAALGAGCVAVAVATGWEDEATLRASGAEHLFASLEEAIGRPPFS